MLFDAVEGLVLTISIRITQPSYHLPLPIGFSYLSMSRFQICPSLSVTIRLTGHHYKVYSVYITWCRYCKQERGVAHPVELARELNSFPSVIKLLSGNLASLSIKLVVLNANELSDGVKLAQQLHEMVDKAPIALSKLPSQAGVNSLPPYIRLLKYSYVILNMCFILACQCHRGRRGILDESRGP